MKGIIVMLLSIASPLMLRQEGTTLASPGLPQESCTPEEAEVAPDACAEAGSNGADDKSEISSLGQNSDVFAEEEASSGLLTTQEKAIDTQDEAVETLEANSGAQSDEADTEPQPETADTEPQPETADFLIPEEVTPSEIATDPKATEATEVAGDVPSTEAIAETPPTEGEDVAHTEDKSAAPTEDEGVAPAEDESATPTSETLTQPVAAAPAEVAVNLSAKVEEAPASESEEGTTSVVRADEAPAPEDQKTAPLAPSTEVEAVVQRVSSEALPKTATEDFAALTGDANPRVEEEVQVQKAKRPETESNAIPIAEAVSAAESQPGVEQLPSNTFRVTFLPKSEMESPPDSVNWDTSVSSKSTIADLAERPLPGSEDVVLRPTQFLSIFPLGNY